MLSPQAVYAIAGTGVVLIFAIPTFLTIWWRRRMLKEQKANADSFLQGSTAPTPGAIDPDDYTTSKPGSPYPQKPGGGNVEFPSVRLLIALSGEGFGVLIRCDYYNSTRAPLSLAEGIRRASAHYPLSAKSRRDLTILDLPLCTRRCEHLRCARTTWHTQLRLASR